MAKMRKKSCPQCGKRFQWASVAQHPAFPFCSIVCKNIDLGNWVDGKYALVEDLSRGQDLKLGGLNLDEIDDPDLRAALEDLNEG